MPLLKSFARFTIVFNQNIVYICTKKQKMKSRIYIDTSVFGGFFDVEFEEFTRPLFERIMNKEIRILFSSVTEDELAGAPEKVKQNLLLPTLMKKL